MSQFPNGTRVRCRGGIYEAGGPRRSFVVRDHMTHLSWVAKRDETTGEVDHVALNTQLVRGDGPLWWPESHLEEVPADEE